MSVHVRDHEKVVRGDQAAVLDRWSDTSWQGRGAG